MLLKTVKIRCKRCRKDFDFDVKLTVAERILSSHELKAEELVIGTRFVCGLTPSNDIRMTEVCVAVGADEKKTIGHFGVVVDGWVEVDTEPEFNRQKMPSNPRRPLGGRKKILKDDQ